MPAPRSSRCKPAASPSPGGWSYDGDPATFFTTWNGKCTAGSCLQNGVAAVATTFLHLQVIGSDAVVNPSPAGTIYNADCPNNVCIFRYPVGTTVTLTPVAGPFAGWLQLYSNWPTPCVGKSPCTITMDGEKAVKAVFSPLQMNLGWNRGGHIEVSGQGCGTRCVFVPYGTTVKVAAVADPGYHLQVWRGICDGAKTKYCNVTMRDNRSAFANFVSDDGIGTIQQPITLYVPFRVSVRGAGTVSGPKGLDVRAGLLAGRVRAGPPDRAHRDADRHRPFRRLDGRVRRRGQHCIIRASAPPSGGYRAVAALFN